MDPFLLAGIAFLSPILVAVFTRTSMSSKVKMAIAIAVSALIAIVYVVLSGHMDFSQLAVTIPAVFGLQQAVFRLLMQKIAASVEANAGFTDPKPAVVEAPIDPPVLEETPAKG